jgi:hypothetical protein
VRDGVSAGQEPGEAELRNLNEIPDHAQAIQLWEAGVVRQKYRSTTVQMRERTQRQRLMQGGPRVGYFHLLAQGQTS